MIVDSHNHTTKYSPDATQTREEMIQAATEVGLHGIAATDHYDIGSMTPYGEEWVFDPAEYCAQIYPHRRLPSRRRKGDPPGFLCGIEIGYIPEYIDRLTGLMSDYPWDIVIMSLHLIRGIDPFHEPEKIYKPSLKDTYRDILLVIAESAEMMPDANIIGHYDYFSRYVPQEEPKMLYRHAPHEFDNLFRVMIENGQALEINTGTIAKLYFNRGYALEEAMPDEEILARYRELGGSLISISSDAHHTNQIARLVPETCAWLQKQGITDHVWFEKRKPVRESFAIDDSLQIDWNKRV
ncbi:MAG: histidinol-phosphatase HisJ family protein [Clostridiaceae bacterium]|nr:histidinol-phosphatase HisJ family protein [Clostridiaceae bacterium]